jgi:repressor LexA
MFAPNDHSCYLAGAGKAEGGDMRDLTPRQRQILEFVDEEARRRGYPPSVREIGKAVGLTSTSTVHAHLSALVAKGYLLRDPTKPRALGVQFEASSGAPLERRPVRHVPVVGDVAAGTGVLAAENIDEVQPLPSDFTGDGPVFMLRVRGESMIEAGILDGDIVVVQRTQDARNGEIVVALAGDDESADEATVKRFFRENGRVRLQPENSALEPIYAEHVQVLGRVTGVFRQL